MTCKTGGRHWYAYYGWVGSSSPVCVRCGEPNPNYRREDDVKLPSSGPSGSNLGATQLLPEAIPLQELRTSERRTFGTCPQQWWWAYPEGLFPVRKPPALWFGLIWHDALAKWYRLGLDRGPHPAETFEKLADNERRIYVTNSEEEEAFVDAKVLGINMAKRYVETYGRDERWHFLAIEETFALIFKRGGIPYLRYLLTMDGVVRDLETGRIVIVEHKTTRRMSFQHLRLDNQAGSYYAAAPYVLALDEILPPGEVIRGIEYNFARKGLGDERPRNAAGLYTNNPTKKHYVEQLKDVVVSVGGTLLGEVRLNGCSLDALEVMARNEGITVLGEVSKRQPPEEFHREFVIRTPNEQITQLNRIRDEARYMERMRAGDPAYPILKTPGEHCNWCVFNRMCELHEEGDTDAVEGFKTSMMITQDPYAQYHKEA
jgi:hypothetical protein